MYCVRSRISRQHETQGNTHGKTEANSITIIIRSTSLNQEHSYIHSGISDVYRCNYCEKSFRFASSMYAHRKKAHPNEEQYHSNIFTSKHMDPWIGFPCKICEWNMKVAKLCRMVDVDVDGGQCAVTCFPCANICGTHIIIIERKWN